MARPRPRRALGSLAFRVARRWHELPVISLEYPPSARPEPRYGYGKPPHPQLESLLKKRDAAYIAHLGAILGYRADLTAIPARSDDPLEARWRNPWQPGLDLAALYSFLRDREPARYVEIGSGVSTLWARRAIDDGGLPTRITSIDPSPRVRAGALDPICDEVRLEALEEADLSDFGTLRAGDVVFMDGSHGGFMNSDVTVFFLEVLPALPVGVLVGIHDVFLPYDYLPEWSERYYTEQYLLATLLLGGGGGLRVELPCYYVTQRPALAETLDPLWEGLEDRDVDRRGFSFWLSKGAR